MEYLSELITPTFRFVKNLRLNYIKIQYTAL